MSPGRTEAFSDGVFSIAATLLVLDLKVPAAHGDLLAQLARQWPAYASYIVSFLTIGIIWINHHVIFAQLRSVNRTLLVLNLLLLLTVALTPFPTAIVADYLDAGHDEAVAGAVYGLAMTAMGVTFGTLWMYVLRKDALRTSAIAPERKRVLLLRFAVGAPIYAGAMAVALVSAKASLLIYAALAVYYLIEPIPSSALGNRA